MKQRTLLIGFAATLILVAGACQTAKPPSEEDILAKFVADATAAFKAGDVNAFIGFLAESFYCPELGGRTEFADFLNNTKAMDYLSNMEIDTSQSKTELTGKKATVGPITIKGSFGSVTTNFTCLREPNGWKASKMEVNL
jgi:hypothetical protein